MAQRYYGLDRGTAGHTYVTEGAATTAGLDVEVRIDRAVAWTKKDLFVALERIKQHILTSKTNNLVE